MASHPAGPGRDARAGSEDFESGLDYGAFVEDDADTQPTTALPRTSEEGRGENPTLALDRDALAAAGRSAGMTGPRRAAAGTADAERARALDREDITATRPAPAAGHDTAWDRYPDDGTGSSYGAGSSHSTGSSPAASAAYAPAPSAGGAAAGATAVSGARAVGDGPSPEERARLPKAGPRVAQVLLALLAPLVLLLGAVRLVATPLFLWLEYHRPGFPADSYGFTTDDRMTYGSAGLDYLHNLAGPRYLSDLTHQGAPLFSAAEVSHMSDVKTVMLLASAALVVLGLVCLLLALSLHRTSPGGVRRALFAGALWLLVALVVLAFLAVTGWQGFFAGFHRMFFADGTWTFSVADPLIRLYPEQFWTDAALAVGLLSLLGVLLALVLAAPTRRRRELAQDRRDQLEATRLRWAREEAYGER